MIAQAIDGLFAKSYFSICTVDSILEALHRDRRTEAYRLLHTLHCVEYRTMRAELRERLPALVAEALAPPEPSPVTDAVIARVFDGAQP